VRGVCARARLLCNGMSRPRSLDLTFRCIIVRFEYSTVLWGLLWDNSDDYLPQRSSPPPVAAAAAAAATTTTTAVALGSSLTASVQAKRGSSICRIRLNLSNVQLAMRNSALDSLRLLAQAVYTAELRALGGAVVVCASPAGDAFELLWSGLSAVFAHINDMLPVSQCDNSENVRRVDRNAAMEVLLRILGASSRAVATRLLDFVVVSDGLAEDLRIDSSLWDVSDRFPSRTFGGRTWCHGSPFAADGECARSFLA
jgi:hypothetical protein